MTTKRRLFAAGKISKKSVDPVVAIVATVGDAGFKITHYPAPVPKKAA